MIGGGVNETDVEVVEDEEESRMLSAVLVEVVEEESKLIPVVVVLLLVLVVVVVVGCLTFAGLAGPLYLGLRGQLRLLLFLWVVEPHLHFAGILRRRRFFAGVHTGCAVEPSCSFVFFCFSPFFLAGCRSCITAPISSLCFSQHVLQR